MSDHSVRRFLYGTVGYANVYSFMSGNREKGVSAMDHFRGTLLINPKDKKSWMLAKAPGSGDSVRIPRIPLIRRIDESSSIEHPIGHPILEDRGHPGRYLTRRDLSYRIRVDGRLHRWSSGDIESFLRARAEKIFPDGDFSIVRTPRVGRSCGGYNLSIKSSDFELRMGGADGPQFRNLCDIGFNLEDNEVRKIISIISKIYTPEFNPHAKTER